MLRLFSRLADMLREFVQYLVDAVRRPRAELTRRQRQLRYAAELVGHCWRVLQRHRAEGMAAELTYRTIFSLIPLVVLGLVTFRVFGGMTTIESRVEDQLFSFFGVPDVPNVAYASDFGDEEPSEISGGSPPEVREIPPIDSIDETLAEIPPLASDEPPPDKSLTENLEVDSKEDARQVQASIRWAIRELTQKVSDVDFASIGVIGLLLFIYAAVALSDAVEGVFNLIYDAPTERPIHLRIAIHWAIITLGSALLVSSLYLSGQLVDYIESSTGVTISSYMSHILALLSDWVFLFLLYALMPNTKVSLRAAAIGSLVAAVLWECAKFGFQIYVSKAVPYSNLYGSLGLIPLFLFWVYVTWFIFLFGLVWTYTLQTARGRVPTKEEDETIEELLPADPQWMLLVMTEAGLAFQSGKTLKRDDLGAKLKLPNRVVHPMLDALVDKQLLRRIEAEQDVQYVLARPAEKIAIAEIITAGQHDSSSQSFSWRALRKIRDQTRRSTADVTLEDLLREDM